MTTWRGAIVPLLVREPIVAAAGATFMTCLSSSAAVFSWDLRMKTKRSNKMQSKPWSQVTVTGMPAIHFKPCETYEWGRIKQRREHKDPLTLGGHYVEVPKYSDIIKGTI